MFIPQAGRTTEAAVMKSIAAAAVNNINFDSTIIHDSVDLFREEVFT